MAGLDKCQAASSLTPAAGELRCYREARRQAALSGKVIQRAVHSPYLMSECQKTSIAHVPAGLQEYLQLHRF
ncbi:hypothetical protein BaRGS_00026903 [Batillaria attramentaria]|uniref:Uncharacterized protein n=1 Tax=Batillaria attramentaria TaxID=370345 RepID=A0ABD0K4Y4_9CAEN